MKYYILPLLLLTLLFSCKKDITQVVTDETIPAGSDEYVQWDTTHYYDGNVTAYQFQTQEINLVAGANNTFSAAFAGVTLKFSNISHPTSWISGQSAGTFNVIQTSTTQGILSSSSPRFSVSGYANTSSGYTNSNVTDKDGITYVIYNPQVSQVYLTIPGVLIMSQYSPTTFAIMPGAYHTRQPIIAPVE